MKNMIQHIVMAAVAVLALVWADECFAQRYPERRQTRQGNKAYNKGDYPAAEVLYRKALAENSELWQADYNLGNAAYKQERLDEAAKTWRRVAADSLRSDADKAEALFGVGNALFGERKFEEAVEAYKSSLRLVPDDTECKFNLAYAQKMLQEQQNQQQQQQNDQNQDKEQNQDQNNDQNQDNNQNQDKNDNRDQQNKDQEPQGDNKDKQQNDKPQQQPQNQPQGGQQPRMSPQQADQMLQAIQGEEDKTRDKLDKQKAVAVGRSGKNW